MSQGGDKESNGETEFPVKPKGSESNSETEELLDSEAEELLWQLDRIATGLERIQRVIIIGVGFAAVGFAAVSFIIWAFGGSNFFLRSRNLSVADDSYVLMERRSMERRSSALSDIVDKIESGDKSFGSRSYYEALGHYISAADRLKRLTSFETDSPSPDKEVLDTCYDIRVLLDARLQLAESARAAVSLAALFDPDRDDNRAGR